MHLNHQLLAVEQMDQADVVGRNGAAGCTGSECHSRKLPVGVSDRIQGGRYVDSCPRTGPVETSGLDHGITLAVQAERVTHPPGIEPLKGARAPAHARYPPRTGTGSETAIP